MKTLFFIFIISTLILKIESTPFGNYIKRSDLYSSPFENRRSNENIYLNLNSDSEGNGNDKEESDSSDYYSYNEDIESSKPVDGSGEDNQEDRDFPNDEDEIEKEIEEQNQKSDSQLLIYKNNPSLNGTCVPLQEAAPDCAQYNYMYKDLPVSLGVVEAIFGKTVLDFMDVGKCSQLCYALPIISTSACSGIVSDMNSHISSTLYNRFGKFDSSNSCEYVKYLWGRYQMVIPVDKTYRASTNFQLLLLLLFSAPLFAGLVYISIKRRQQLRAQEQKRFLCTIPLTNGTEHMTSTTMPTSNSNSSNRNTNTNTNTNNNNNSEGMGWFSSIPRINRFMGSAPAYDEYNVAVPMYTVRDEMFANGADTTGSNPESPEPLSDRSPSTAGPHEANSNSNNSNNSNSNSNSNIASNNSNSSTGPAPDSLSSSRK